MSNRITDEQIANLHKLGNHLAALPDNYRHFNIEYFANLEEEGFFHVEPDSITAQKLNTCGASACGIGHGPAIGLPAMEGESWLDYGLRVFGAHLSCGGEIASLWYGVFSDHWRGEHNHHHALVRRLDAWLAGHGYPARVSEAGAA